MKFKVDTGAEVTAVTKLALTQLSNVQLHPVTKALCGPDRKPLKVLGQIEKLKHNLLGLPAIKDLNLLVMVNQMSSNYAEAIHKFPSVFTGLGSLSGEFEIQLKSDAKPFALYTPRKVPYALRSKVKDELDRMEAMGVITKVENPTPWCAGMVVVPKKDGKVRMVKTVKKLLSSSSDMHMALLSYRATPLPWCNLSPAELLMGRRLKTDIPQIKELLIPNWPHLTDFAEKDRQYKEKQKKHFDRCHGIRALLLLPNNSEVWVNTQRSQVSGQVVSPAATPRSYIIDVPTGCVRRNRAHIIPQPATSQNNDEPPSHNTTNRERIVTHSRSGVSVRPPDRLTYQ